MKDRTRDSNTLATTSKQGDRYKTRPKGKKFRQKKKLSKEKLAELMSKSVCRNCKQKGRCAKSCPDKKSSERFEGKPKAGDDCVSTLIAEVNFSFTTDDWVLDTGATDHMTFDRSYFVRYQELEQPQIILYGDGNQGQGIGVGDIKIRSVLSDGSCCYLWLTNVLYAPGIKRKLLSLAAITDKGNHGESEQNSIKVKNASGREILMARRQGFLYFANINEVVKAALATSSSKTLSI